MKTLRIYEQSPAAEKFAKEVGAKNVIFTVERAVLSYEKTGDDFDAAYVDGDRTRVNLYRSGKIIGQFNNVARVEVSYSSGEPLDDLKMISHHLDGLGKLLLAAKIDWRRLDREVLPVMLHSDLEWWTNALKIGPLTLETVELYKKALSRGVGSTEEDSVTVNGFVLYLWLVLMGALALGVAEQ